MDKRVPADIAPNVTVPGASDVAGSNDFEIIAMFDNGAVRDMSSGKHTTTRKARDGGYD